MSDKMLKQFYVVEFPADQTIEVVPKTWLSDDNKKCTFSSNTPKGFKKLQEDPNSRPDPLWTSWDIIVKTSSDSFSRADKKAKKHLKPNYIDSSDLEIGAGYSQSTEQENVEGSEEINTVDQAIQPIPITINNDERLSTLIEEFRAFQVASLQNQLVLQEEIKDLKTILLRSLSSSSKLRSSKIAWLIKNEDQLQEVNTTLADDTIPDHEIQFFSRLGGDSVTLAVNNTLKAIIKHEFALILRFTDSSKKVSFGGTRCCKLVKDSVREFYYKDGNVVTEKIKSDLVDSKLDSFIAKWLRDSINRGDGGKQKLSKAKNGSAKVDKTLKGPEEAESNAESD
ncbi:hypothetical protein Fcan01_22144 [Folsomia candida]|uniref:DUF4806 domain-containing protein n=1 Tax=Folsomia candida TaxID=158441 RepID=A0A226DEL9_FOLCA|nr:hypothetical protein Fcan01_22144 [Folsomia candida]